MQLKVTDASLLDRRRRLHELVLALIQQQDDIELLDSQSLGLEGDSLLEKAQDPARWLDRNRRVLNKYQAMIRSAITIDALLDSEHGDLDVKSSNR